MALRVADLEVVFTADAKQVQQAEKDVRSIGERIEKKPVTQKIDGDAKGAVGAIDKVAAEGKKLVSQGAALKLDADISRAEKSLARAKDRLEDLEVRAQGGLDVRADVARATGQLQKLERHLQGLVAAKETIVVDADMSRAISAFDEAKEPAEAAGGDAGDKFGAGLVAALASIPIVGAVVGIAKAAADALIQGFQEGLQVEVRRDRLQALTGVDEDDAARFGRAAAQAYANNFGEGIAENMEAARLGLQFDLIDDDATMAASQRVIEGLAGISDVLGEDVQPVARATAVLLRTGLAASAQEAFDIIAAGEREGLNIGEDLLDTLTEYGSTFAQLGLTGSQSLGLLNQALEAGAPNTDFFADALRELGIRIREGEDDTAGFLRQLHLVPGDLQAAFVAGGPAAAEGLDRLLDALRDVEDPVERDRIAVGLLGTQFEDLQFDLDRLDLSTAVDGMNGVEGAAQRMFDTLSSNDASALERAQRNVEVAVDGMQGALAVAFSDPLQEAADWVSQNRGPMLQFFSDLANGALDFGEGLVVAAANGTIAFGEFVSGPLRELVQTMVDIFAMPQFAVFGFETDELQALADGLGEFDETTAAAAQTMTDTLLPALDEAREGLNGFLDPEIAAGFLNDATLRLASSIDAVGYAADGATPLVDAFTVAQDGTVAAGAELESQLLNSVSALNAELDAARAAGEGQDALAARYDTGTAAMVDQLMQMGLNEGQAQALIDTILATPESAVTRYESNAAAEAAGVSDLANRIVTLPDGSVIVTANTTPASTEVDGFITRYDGRRIRVFVDSQGDQQYQVAGSNVRYEARGDILEFMAAGGLRGLTPMQQGQAVVVPPSTWRVVGDRSDVAEAYIPLDGSPRSLSIMLEAMRRFGIQPMADGAVVGARREAAPAASMSFPMTLVEGASVEELAAEAGRGARKAVRKQLGRR